MSTYLTAITNICSQVGDPNLDTYKARAQAHFIRAIHTLINQDNFNQEDIPYYFKLKTDLSFASNPYDSKALKILRIINIFPPAGTAKDLIITIKTIEDLSKIAGSADLQPSDSDLFIYKIGTSLYALYNTSSSNFTPASDTLYMVYIEDIDNSAWIDATDFQDTSGNYLFSFRFVNRAIDLAVQTLLAEIKAEAVAA
ncbi:MAG: hypothetical protein PHC43_00900 [Candidatus Marinimicrobia bacterium]|nr:hypothetical protein [Candidatus Neomarinimicrobiota bacterium]MDD5229866.1 hypothetical protein [Candidatus Neomarinimicrobiota bacterium]MDD5540760.1 hypothetical protein [Candidatus Neomarinimicrobiota bacterium]